MHFDFDNRQMNQKIKAETEEGMNDDPLMRCQQSGDYRNVVLWQHRTLSANNFIWTFKRAECRQITHTHTLVSDKMLRMASSFAGHFVLHEPFSALFSLVFGTVPKAKINKHNRTRAKENIDRLGENRLSKQLPFSGSKTFDFGLFMFVLKTHIYSATEFSERKKNEKIIQVIDVGGGTRPQCFFFARSKKHVVKLKETANKIFDFLFLHFRFICFCRMQR